MVLLRYLALLASLAAIGSSSGVPPHQPSPPRPPHASSIYVSPHGSDKNPGTKRQPFQTLERAQKAVRDVNSHMKADLTVHVTKGTYYLDAPLNFTAADSGSNGHRVTWEGQDAAISGGKVVTGWSLYDRKKGIYSAPVSVGFESRHLFADQKHAQRARQAVNRTWIEPFEDGYSIVNKQAEYLLKLPGLEKTEFSALNSFTHRFTLVSHAEKNKTLIMKQPWFQLNNIGYDTNIEPHADWGFYIENALALLDEENEFFLDSKKGRVYYKPAAGKDINKMYIVLGKLEQLLVVSGTYDKPVHDLTFKGFSYMHTTWNRISSKGYVDQQTGGYMADEVEVAADKFESTRPHWWQIPGSVQVSAARNITFTGGSMVAIMGGFGIGNDANAHTSGVGLGTSHIEISGMDFLETGANAITMGGIQADSHHPSDPRMIVEYGVIKENTFKQTSRTITSGAAIFVSYTANTQITHNDLYDLPYSGICWGYGWGSNDEGGSPEYVNRGLYKYQPLYTTPTTMKNGLIANNLVQNHGLKHQDNGAIYTLSKSPDTVLARNWIVFEARPRESQTGLYHDEGSRDYENKETVIESPYARWMWRNEGPTGTTGNITSHDIAVNQPNLTDDQNRGDKFYDIFRWSTYDDLTPEMKSWAYSAGLPIEQRRHRPVSMCYGPSEKKWCKAPVTRDVEP